MSYYDKDRTADDMPDGQQAAPRMHNWPKPALNSAAQYQISGMPAAASLSNGETITFTRVTRAITVVTDGTGATIDFNNTDQDPYPLIENVPQRFEVLATSLSVVIVPGTATAVNVVAELTGIQSDQCPDWSNADNDIFTITS